MAVRDGLLPERYVGPQPIGRGGMGQIYRATDTALGRAVAIKVLDDRYAWDENVRARFTREALAAARLSGNSNIVTIYDVGEHHERPFIVMEYLAGGSLDERLQRGRVPTPQALEWLEQAAGALDAAHREGVVHRDVKPANLLLDRRDAVHVADFGIASAAGLASLTQTGTVLGTASYISPEQAQGDRTTPASDLYSLAVVAFELLTGRRPFTGDSAAAEAVAHVSGEVPSVRDVDPDAPAELDPVFAKALAKDPGRRYTSGAEFVAALRAALEQAAGTTRVIGATAPTRVVARPRQSRNALLPALLGAALVLAGIVAALAVTRGGGKPAAKLLTTTVLETVNATSVSTLVTETAPPATTTTAPPAATTTAVDAVAENNQAWQLMQQGNFQAALPLLQDAQRRLNGQGSLAEAYTSYNLGYTLVRLGQCDAAIPYLDRARQLEPARHEVRDAIKQAQHCRGGGKDNGDGG